MKPLLLRLEKKDFDRLRPFRPNLLFRFNGFSYVDIGTIRQHYNNLNDSGKKGFGRTTKIGYDFNLWINSKQQWQAEI